MVDVINPITGKTATIFKAPPRQFPKARRPGSKEIAALIVRGTPFTNWTSVRVEQHVTQWYPIFQFECSEESPIPLEFYKLQFIPGDVVQVVLGGHDVIFGYITERHVAFDSTSHAVRLIGVGKTWDLTNSSVPIDKLGNHDGKPWLAFAQAIASHLGIPIVPFGNVDGTPFQNIQVQPGAVISQEMERYAKLRNILIGSNHNGSLRAIGEHPAVSTGFLQEGYNILRANGVWRDQSRFKHIFSMGQNTGSDSGSGAGQNQQIAYRPGTSTRNRHIVVVTDVADTQHGVERRADMEVVFTEGSRIELNITVQGWFKDNNKSEEIWRAGEYYQVTSPSLIMNGNVMGCSGCTYEQNNNGSTTTLQMTLPVHMNGQLNITEAVREEAARRERDLEQKKANEKPVS
jgi:prophage tail gpP-like protein